LFGLDVTPQLIPSSIYISVQLSSYSLSVVTTALAAVIIVVRILMVSRMPGASRQPQIAMEIIVESAVLYAVSALVYTSILSSLHGGTVISAAYIDYAEVFFAYMAVEYHSSSPPHPLTLHHRTLPPP
jgi:energy-converting hydrogenase Eha subunit G